MGKLEQEIKEETTRIQTLKTYRERFDARMALDARLKELRESRNHGVKFPYKCSKCGALTERATSGNLKGAWICPDCGIGQECVSICHR